MKVRTLNNEVLYEIERVSKEVQCSFLTEFGQCVCSAKIKITLGLCKPVFFCEKHNTEFLDDLKEGVE
jgi:hypothetical protein